MGSIKKLKLHANHHQLILEHLISVLPNEGCGILAGIGEKSVHVFHIPNELNSPTHFNMEPKAMWQAFQRIEAEDWNFLAIYHSHPNGPDCLSWTDLENHHYPKTIQLLFYLNNQEWYERAFIIKDKKSYNIPIEIVTK